MLLARRLKLIKTETAAWNSDCCLKTKNLLLARPQLCWAHLWLMMPRSLSTRPLHFGVNHWHETRLGLHLLHNLEFSLRRRVRELKGGRRSELCGGLIVLSCTDCHQCKGFQRHQVYIILGLGSRYIKRQKPTFIHHHFYTSIAAFYSYLYIIQYQVFNNHLHFRNAFYLFLSRSLFCSRGGLTGGERLS